MAAILAAIAVIELHKLKIQIGGEHQK